MAYERFVSGHKTVKAIVALMNLGVPSDVATANVLNALRVAGIEVKF